MKNLSSRALLAAALVASAVGAPAGAGTASASFQASLTIVGSCAIDSTRLRPQVACSHASAAYRIDQGSISQFQDNVWTVTF